MTKKIEQRIIVPESLKGERLDKALATLFPDYSRSIIKSWIEEEKITVDDSLIKPKTKLSGGEEISINATLETQTALQAEEIPLEIAFEDEHLMVIDKPPGLVVHPGAGNPSKTLVNALLFHHPDLKELPRAGLIHRLDKNTSGLLIVAKTLPAFTHLVQMLQDRDINRHYVALIQGNIISGNTIDAPIGRHPTNRLKMAVVKSGKPARTHYRVIKRFNVYTYLSLKLETGRTHQIRVHLAHQNFPIVGDPTYGGRKQLPKGAPETLIETLNHFKRQALHAVELDFIHPITKQEIHLRAELPQDFQNLLQVLNDSEKLLKKS